MVFESAMEIGAVFEKDGSGRRNLLGQNIVFGEKDNVEEIYYASTPRRIKEASFQTT